MKAFYAAADKMGELASQMDHLKGQRQRVPEPLDRS